MLNIDLTCGNDSLVQELSHPSSTWLRILRCSKDRMTYEDTLSRWRYGFRLEGKDFPHDPTMTLHSIGESTHHTSNLSIVTNSLFKFHELISYTYWTPSHLLHMDVVHRKKYLSHSWKRKNRLDFFITHSWWDYTRCITLKYFWNGFILKA